MGAGQPLHRLRTREAPWDRNRRLFADRGYQFPRTVSPVGPTRSPGLQQPRRVSGVRFRRPDRPLGDIASTPRPDPRRERTDAHRRTIHGLDTRHRAERDWSRCHCSSRPRPLAAPCSAICRQRLRPVVLESARPFAHPRLFRRRVLGSSGNAARIICF